MAACCSGQLRPAPAPPMAASAPRLHMTSGRTRSTPRRPLQPREAPASIPVVRPQASVGQRTGEASEVASAVAVLKRAADKGSVPPAEVFQAMRQLELQKLKFDDWPQRIGGSKSPGRAWRLVFQADSKVLKSVLKGDSNGGGQYFPVTAVVTYDAAGGITTNSAYLGQIASLKFTGTWESNGRNVSFAFSDRLVKIGPFDFNASLDKGSKGTTGSFVFFYADDDIIVARGKSGGTAFWRRALPSWLLENGVV